MAWASVQSDEEQGGSDGRPIPMGDRSGQIIDPFILTWRVLSCKMSMHLFIRSFGP
jgi:hypothetical protein